MPANEDCYEPADETVFEVWVTRELCGDILHDWAYTQKTRDEAESVVGVIENNFTEHIGHTLLSVDIYETTRRRVGGKVYEAPVEEAE